MFLYLFVYVTSRFYTKKIPRQLKLINNKDISSNVLLNKLGAVILCADFVLYPLDNFLMCITA